MEDSDIAFQHRPRRCSLPVARRDPDATSGWWPGSHVTILLCGGRCERLDGRMLAGMKKTHAHGQHRAKPATGAPDSTASSAVSAGKAPPPRRVRPPRVQDRFQNRRLGTRRG